MLEENIKKLDTCLTDITNSINAQKAKSGGGSVEKLKLSQVADEIRKLEVKPNKEFTVYLKYHRYSYSCGFVGYSGVKLISPTSKQTELDNMVMQHTESDPLVKQTVTINEFGEYYFIGSLGWQVYGESSGYDIYCATSKFQITKDNINLYNCLEIEVKSFSTKNPIIDVNLIKI